MEFHLFDRYEPRQSKKSKKDRARDNDIEMDSEKEREKLYTLNVMKIQNWLSKHWVYMRRLQIELAEPVKSVDVNKCIQHMQPFK